VDTQVLLENTARSLVEEFKVKGCHFRLLSRDQLVLESAASYGLSEEFLNKGPIDAERSVSEALKGNVVGVLDCATDSRIQYPKEHAEEGITSMLTVPLETRGQVIGVMRLYSAERREFSDDEIEFFKVAALFCTSAIIHSMFHSILGQVTEATRNSLDLAKVLDSIVSVVCEELRARGTLIELVDQPAGRLEPRASYGLSREFVDTSGSIFDPSVIKQVLGGECVQIHEAAIDDRVREQQLIAREGAASVLLVPLTSRGRGVGVISLYTHQPYRFAVDELQLMTAIGDQCSLAIDNAKMYSALKHRYESLVDDFQLWFEHTQARPLREPSKTTG
jgi:GAF domain-containing protein